MILAPKDFFCISKCASKNVLINVDETLYWSSN